MAAFMGPVPGGDGSAIQEAMARRSQGVSPFSQQSPGAPSAQPLPQSPQGAQPPQPNLQPNPQPNPQSGSQQNPASFESRTILGALKNRLETISRMQEQGAM